MSKVVYGGLGWCAVALAFAGVFVPGLPVTVFVLIASFCFSRSSPRFEAWLMEHRWFGPPLRRFRDSGGMPRSAKRAALISMWTAIGISSLLLARMGMKGPLITMAAGVLGTLTIVYAVRTTPEVEIAQTSTES